MKNVGHIGTSHITLVAKVKMYNEMLNQWWFKK